MKYVCFVACACLLTLSCSEDASPTIQSEAIIASEYFPLEGTQNWTYETLHNEVVDTGSSEVVGSTSVEIQGESKQVYTISSTTQFVEGSYYEDDYGIVYEYASDEPNYFLKNNIEVGDSWNWVFSSEPLQVVTCVGIHSTKEIVAQDGSVSLFENVVELRVETAGEVLGELFFAKDIGVVYMLAFEHSKPRSAKLISYNGKDYAWK